MLSITMDPYMKTKINPCKSNLKQIELISIN